MEANLSKSLDLVGISEGGYSNRATDRGGPTDFGITLKTYQTFIKKDATEEDLKAMSLWTARAIFRRVYWNGVHASELPSGLDYAMFDFSVNSGPRRAMEVLQEVLGVGVDGLYGPVTHAAIEKADVEQTIVALCEARLKWLKTLTGKGGWKDNPGWEPRVENVKREALMMHRGHLD